MDHDNYLKLHELKRPEDIERLDPTDAIKLLVPVTHLDLLKLQLQLKQTLDEFSEQIQKAFRR